MNTKHEPLLAHFFTTGEFEIWAPDTSADPFDRYLHKIADGLSGETALAYEWCNMEIRLHGKTMTKQQGREFLRK